MIQLFSNFWLKFENMISEITDKKEQLDSLCKRYKVSALYLFGSATTSEFNDQSDIDFAVVFDSNLDPVEHGEAYFGLYDALNDLYGRKIDLLSYRVVKNPVFKSELDRTKITLYAA